MPLDAKPRPAARDERPRRTDHPSLRLAAALEELELALRRETRALAQADPSALLEAVERKRAALGGVEALLASADGQALLEAVAAGTAPASWARVLELLERCRGLNEAAGGAAAAARRSTAAALRLLAGTPGPAGYAENGQAARKPRGRDLAVC
ncbi:MAG TPA: flagellar export chaperone FlgN [Gammaproteobacteria bacterium]